ncbi:MAG: hypothetical protein KDA92_24920 [Planctomycetales bacterium]|nr:hypothetical protein [Planctomycetales bacterium]
MNVRGIASFPNMVRLDAHPSQDNSVPADDLGADLQRDLRTVRKQVLQLDQAMRTLADTVGSHESKSSAPAPSSVMTAAAIMVASPETKPTISVLETAVEASVAAAENSSQESQSLVDATNLPPQLALPTYATQVDAPEEAVASVDAALVEFDRTLSSLFDDSKLLAKPGPLLKVLRENIRESVTSVFNNRGPGFIPPFHFGFNFPSEPDPMAHDSSQKQAILEAFHNDPAQVVEYLFGDPATGKTGVVPEMQRAISSADKELSAKVGDVGILLDLVA